MRVGAHVVHLFYAHVCVHGFVDLCMCVHAEESIGCPVLFSPPYTLEAESLTEPGAKLTAEKASTMPSAPHSAEVIGLCVAMPKGCLFIEK